MTALKARSRDPMVTVAMQRLRGQAGFTLIELLVASTLMIIVLGALLALFDTSQKLVPQDQERAEQIRDAETGVFQMTHEMRLAYSLVSATAYSFEANVYEGGQTLHVLFDCSGASSLNSGWGACIRKLIGGNGSTLSARSVLPAFTNTAASGGKPVFTYTRNAKGEATYVAVHVEIPPKGGLASGYPYRITYDDGVYIRNLDV